MASGGVAGVLSDQNAGFGGMGPTAVVGHILVSGETGKVWPLESPSGACDDRTVDRIHPNPGFTMPIKLLIADEFEVVRAGLKSMVAGTNMKIVAEASTGKAAVRLTLKHKPNVAVLGVSMPDGDGLNSLGRIKIDLPDQPVLIFSSFDNPTHMARAVALGASGWIFKTATRESLLEAIRTAATGESAWTREELRRMSGSLATPRLSSDDIEVSLTEREGEILLKMASGLTNKEIAQTLHVSYETIKEHVQNILRKVGVSDRTQAAVWAIRKGLA